MSSCLLQVNQKILKLKVFNILKLFFNILYYELSVKNNTKKKVLYFFLVIFLIIFYFLSFYSINFFYFQTYKNVLNKEL